MDLLSHLLFPLIALIIYDLLKYRYINLSTILLSFFTIILDFDLFLGNHRIYFHNIIFLSIFLVPAIMLKKTKFKKYSKYLVIASFYIGTHLLLDLTYGGIPLLFPFSSKYLTVSFEIQTYSNLKPIFHNYIKFYDKTSKIDWTNISDKPDIKPGIIAWRNSFIILLIFLIPFIFNIKKIKIKNDFK